MHEPMTPGQREALSGLAGAAAHLIQEWAEVDEHGKRHLVISLGQSLRQLNTADAAAEQPDAVPEWRALAADNSRGLAKLPPIEDMHGQLPTGYLRVTESSAAFPGAMWVVAASYGDDLEARLNRDVRQNTTLHLRGWQARRAAYQLLAMAEHVDPDGGTDPADGES